MDVPSHSPSYTTPASGLNPPTLFAVQLIAYLEQEFGIKVGNKDLDINNFHSVNKMVSFVERKRQEDTAAAGR